MCFSGMVFRFLKNFILCFTTDDKIAIRAHVLTAKAFFHLEHLPPEDITFT